MAWQPRILPRLLQVPVGVLMPVITVLCVVGAYALSSRMFDVYLMPLLTRPISPILTTVILATLFGSIVGLLRGPRHGTGRRRNAGVKP